MVRIRRDSPVSDLDVTAEEASLLAQAGCATVGDLLALRAASDVWESLGMGPATARHVDIALAFSGIATPLASVPLSPGPAVEAAVQVEGLGVTFAQQLDGMTAEAIADRYGVDQSAASGLVRDLEACGMVSEAT
jgi:hypothetical protein